MTTPKMPTEAPTLMIESEEDYERALARLSHLSTAGEHTAEALERASLEHAVDDFQKHGRSSETETAD